MLERLRGGEGHGDLDGAHDGVVALAGDHFEVRGLAHAASVHRADVGVADVDRVVLAVGGVEGGDFRVGYRAELLLADEDALVGGAADGLFLLDDVRLDRGEADHDEGHEDERRAREARADLALVHVVEAEHEGRQHDAGLVAVGALDAALRAPQGVDVLLEFA